MLNKKKIADEIASAFNLKKEELEKLFNKINERMELLAKKRQPLKEVIIYNERLDFSTPDLLLLPEEELQKRLVSREEQEKIMALAMAERWKIIAISIIEFLFAKERIEKLGENIYKILTEDAKVARGIAISGTCPTGSVTGQTITEGSII